MLHSVVEVQEGGMPTCIRTVSSVVLSLLLMAIPVPPASPNAQGDIVQ